MNFDFSQQPGRFRWNRNPVKTARPLVSIITPFYNSAKHFLQTSYTVLDQTFPFFEWIIVDDGSTNQESLALLDTVAASDPRIRVFHTPNAGPSAARNFAWTMITIFSFPSVAQECRMECSIHWNVSSSRPFGGKE